LNDRETAAQQVVGLVGQKVAHALRARPLGIVVVHPWHDLANLACLARGIIGGAQRMVEYDDACGPAAATAQAIYGTVAIGAMTALLSETRSEPS
jgi:hypothetical protein